MPIGQSESIGEQRYRSNHEHNGQFHTDLSGNFPVLLNFSPKLERMKSSLNQKENNAHNSESDPEEPEKISVNESQAEIAADIVGVKDPTASANEKKDAKKEAQVVADIVNAKDPLFDPACDPDHPVKITFEDVSAAAYKLKGGIAFTPCTKSHMSQMTGVDIYFKKDLFQYTGSFKERGARNFLLKMSEESRRIGVIATSAGNHALALSYHGAQLDIPVTVVMPRTAPLMKITLCRSHGANVVVTGNNLAESKEFAMRMAAEKGLTYCNGFDHPLILAGQGTCGLEMLEQVRDMDAVIVPIGGGGLVAGIAVALKTMKPSVQIIGVESERSPGFAESMKAGKPIYTPVASTLADGLAVPLVGFNSFATAAPLIDKMVVVKEEFIALSILRLIEMEKVVVEGAGAIGLAAILSGQLPELAGKKVVIPLSGGNIDTTVLGRCLDRGLAADGRLCRFVVVISDRPGGMAELTKTIGELDVSLKDIFHERAWLKHDVFSVAVTCVVETRDKDHAERLEKALITKYKKVRFISTVDSESL